MSSVSFLGDGAVLIAPKLLYYYCHFCCLLELQQCLACCYLHVIPDIRVGLLSDQGSFLFFLKPWSKKS